MVDRGEVLVLCDSATVKAIGRGRVCTLLYDTQEEIVHDLDDETWRFL